MYDICIGNDPSQPNAHVLVTMTDQGAADRIVKAINDEASYLFQCEGQVAFYREVARGEAQITPAMIWAMNVPEAQALIRAQGDQIAVANMREAERKNPKYEGGRSGVIDEADERIGELEEFDLVAEDGTGDGEAAES